MTSSGRRALNPAFAAAHSLAKSKVDVPTPFLHSSSRRIDMIVNEARTTGKLQAVDAGLVAPLPNELFDLRAGMVVDVTIRKSTDQERDQFVFTEETLTMVDLSDNDCKNSSLDERVLRYENVQVMRWKRCMLKGVDVNLSSLVHLMVLDLSGNNLQHFHLNWLPSGIQEIDLSGNQLEVLESNNMHLDRMVSVDLSENRLNSLQSLSGVCWPRLQVFRCHHNPSLKECIMDIFLSAQQALRTLDMSFCQLGLHGDRLDFSMFPELQTILLSFNRLSIIPVIPMSATRVDLTSNRIEFIQGMFADDDHPSSLLELLLQDNYLVELDPVVFSRCVSLRRLDLSSNKLKTLPYQLGFLVQLQHLSLIGNPLHTFKASEIESTKAVMEKLRSRAPRPSQSQGGSSSSSSMRVLLSSVLVSNRSINLSGKPVDLMQLVAELKANPALAWDITGQLVMDRTFIDSVPEDLLPLLPNLTEISLKNNNFREVPSSLTGSCPNLTRLLMSGNAIVNMDGLASISPRMIWAPNLTHLDLSSNRLTNFPGALLKALTNLQVLTLAFNKITSLDDWQILPSTLTQLDLSENSLEGIDDLVLLLGSHCPKLEVLCLHHNCIARIPSIAGLLLDRCPALKFVDFKGNPQHGIRPEMLAKPTCEQLLYLKNRLTEEQAKAANDQMDHLQHDGGTLDRSRIPVTPSKRLSLTQKQDATISGIASTAITDGQGPAPASSEITPEASGEDASLVECRSKIAEYETELDNASLSEAKRYALKRSLAMERSKLIREERRLGLRN